MLFIVVLLGIICWMVLSWICGMRLSICWNDMEWGIWVIEIWPFDVIELDSLRRGWMSVWKVYFSRCRALSDHSKIFCGVVRDVVSCM